MPESNVYLGDCMDFMRTVDDGFFDLTVTDMPYNTTNNEWDVALDLPVVMSEIHRVTKEDGAMVFTAAQPFTTDLINASRDTFRYDLVWEKSIATGFLNANRMPLRAHETVLVFYRKLPAYNPIKHKLDQRPSYKKGNKARGSSNYGKFNHEMDVGSKDGTRFPRSIFQVDYENSFFDSSFESVQKMIHPTQKPIDLFRYFIQMFSNKGDRVADFFMGSQSSRLAAWEEYRNYWGCEKDPDYFRDGCKRFEQFKSQLKLF